MPNQSLVGGAKDDKYTYDLLAIDGGPRPPSDDDLGGSQHSDLDPAPQVGVEPTAGSNNEQVRNLTGLNRMTEKALICVEFSGGAPVMVFAEGMGTQINAGVFNPMVHSGPGIVQITWPPNTLPPIQSKPRAFSNTPLYSVSADWIPNNPNGIEVRTWLSATGALGDAAFTVGV